MSSYIEHTFIITQVDNLIHSLETSNLKKINLTHILNFLKILFIYSE